MAARAKLGNKVRALRRREELTQVQMADRLGISPSYLNLIEHNRRPLSAQLLIKLAQVFGIDVATFGHDDEAQLASDLLEALSDPIFDSHRLLAPDVREWVAGQPELGRAMLTLYQAYRSTRDSAAQRVSEVDEQLVDAPTAKGLPSEEVGDLIQRHDNYFPDLEDAADMLWKVARLSRQDILQGLVGYLESVHGIDVQIKKELEMEGLVRRYDPKRHILELSEVLAPRSRNFQVAHQIGLLDSSEILERLTRDPGLSSQDSKALGRVALANYFAGAVLMPYEPFMEATQEVRHDLELLGHRFRVSFEQVCHRLTTLRRPRAEGIPFHFVRMDVAGNISKRFSSSGFRFARFSGACPRWNEHAAFLTPGMVRVQLSDMADGTRFFCVARTVRDNSGGYHAAHPLHAVGLGCEVRHARDLVYADGIDLEAKAVPIGVACRVCERSDCEQRAFPRLLEPLQVDENRRGRSFYYRAQPNGSGTS